MRKKAVLIVSKLQLMVQLSHSFRVYFASSPLVSSVNLADLLRLQAKADLTKGLWSTDIERRLKYTTLETSVEDVKLHSKRVWKM